MLNYKPLHGAENSLCCFLTIKAPGVSTADLCA